MKYMRTQNLLRIITLGCLIVSCCERAQASVHFRGLAGSYAASDGQLAGGQSLSDWTIELWMKPEVSRFSGLFNNMPEAPWTEMSIGGGDGVFGCLVALDDPQAYHTVSSSAVFTTGEWQLLTIVSTGNVMTAFRNGVSVGSTSLPGNASFAGEHQGNNLGAFDFGLRDLATLPDDGFYLGSLADFRVWDRALSTSEVSNHVTQQPNVTAAGLRNWIPFNETSGNEFHDVVGGLTGSFNSVDLSSDSPTFVTGPEQTAAVPEPGVYAAFVGAVLVGFACVRKLRTQPVPCDPD